MPKKLIAVIAIFGLGAVLNVVTQSYVSAAIGALLVFFLVRGSHTARSVCIWLTVLALVVLSITVIQLLVQSGFGSLSELALTALIFGGGQGGFALWALTRPDVVAWMDDRYLAQPMKPRAEEPPRYV